MAHGLSSCSSWALQLRLSSCGARALVLHGMWDLPRPGLEPESPALAGGFLTSVPPGKPKPTFLNKQGLVSEQKHKVSSQLGGFSSWGWPHALTNQHPELVSILLISWTRARSQTLNILALTNHSLITKEKTLKQGSQIGVSLNTWVEK